MGGRGEPSCVSGAIAGARPCLQEGVCLGERAQSRCETRGLVGDGVCLRAPGSARGRALARVSGARVFMCGAAGARGRGARSCSVAALSSPPPRLRPRARAPCLDPRPRCTHAARATKAALFSMRPRPVGKVERQGVEEVAESWAYLQPRSKGEGAPFYSWPPRVGRLALGFNVVRSSTYIAKSISYCRTAGPTSAACALSSCLLILLGPLNLRWQ